MVHCDVLGPACRRMSGYGSGMEPALFVKRGPRPDAFDASPVKSVG